MLNFEPTRPTYAAVSAKDWGELMRHIRKVYLKPDSQIHYIPSTKAIWIERRGTNEKIGYITETQTPEKRDINTIMIYDDVIHQLQTDLYDENHKEMAFRLLDNIPLDKLKEYMQDVKK